MAKFPCKFSTPCLDPASPVQNLSAESSDGPDFLGLGFPFVSANNPVGGRGGDNLPPPFYFADGCMNVCVSEISQADADLCAQRSAYICSHTPPPGGPPAPTFFFSGLQVCNITCPDGSIFSYRVLPGAFVATSQAEADQQASAYACAAAAFNLMCLSNLPNGCLNAPYSSTITTSERGTPPFVFALTGGSLPPGLAMEQVDAVTALLNGTPTVPGNYSFTLRLTDTNGNFMERTYSFAVLGITNSPPAASQGTAYSFTFSTSGGIAPYTYFLASGALPAGLTLSSEGTISGIPTQQQGSSFGVSVTDSAGNQCVSDFTIANAPCDCTISWFPSVGSCRLRIKGYFDGLVSNCPLGVASGAPAWDGTLSRWDPPPNNVNGEYAAPITPPATSMNGKVLWAVTLVFTGTTFTIAILGDSGGISTTAWSGSLVSSCPIGVYTRNIGCSAGPATLTIEGYVP